MWQLCGVSNRTTRVCWLLSDFGESLALEVGGCNAPINGTDLGVRFVLV
jgi:hypothetical protein